MINFYALSILLIHRELLTDRKQLLNIAVNGILKGFSMVKEKGKIKGEVYRMLENSKRPFVWRQIVSSFKSLNHFGVVFMNKARALS